MRQLNLAEDEVVKVVYERRRSIQRCFSDDLLLSELLGDGGSPMDESCPKVCKIYFS